MTVYAYYRVSTDRQDYNSQKLGVIELAKKKNIIVDVEVIDDGKSGMLPPDKRKLGYLLDNIQTGDIIFCSEISRLGRTLFMIMDILKTAMEKGVMIYTVKEGYELGDNLTSKVLAFAFGLSSEIERNLISQRSKEGVERARKEGKHIGRPKGMTYRKLEKYTNYIKELLAEGKNKCEISEKCNCNWSTLNRFMKEKCLQTIKTKPRKPVWISKINCVELFLACQKSSKIKHLVHHFNTSQYHIKKELEHYGIKLIDGVFCCSPQIYSELKMQSRGIIPYESEE